MARRPATPAVLLLLSAHLPATGAAEPAGYVEERVKAEFVERFTRFIEWPTAGEDAADLPFVVCLFGLDPVGTTLQGMAGVRRFKGRRLDVRLLHAPEGATGCRVVWVAAARQDELAALLAHTGGRPILTVGDTDGFARRGVLFELRRSELRVRFEVNLPQTRRSGLLISSKLLRLGTIVGTLEAGP